METVGELTSGFADAEAQNDSAFYIRFLDHFSELVNLRWRLIMRVSSETSRPVSLDERRVFNRDLLFWVHRRAIITLSKNQLG